MILDKSGGFLLFNKKPGITSFESLAIVKKAFATGKVGHTGTLDKFASGLLLLLVGRAVKLAPLFENCVKEYTGQIFFGAETDTLDPEGEIIARGNIPRREEIEAVLETFRGEIMQSPPAYSAIHVNGRRASELAREGKEPSMKKRPVTVHKLEILSFTPPQAEIFCRVSSGTYIRSLARDIALEAGTRAHLTALKRSGVGPFSLEDAVCYSGEDDRESIVHALKPIDRTIFNLLCLSVFLLIEEKAVEAFFHGKPLSKLLEDAEFYPGQENLSFAGVFWQNTLVAILEYRNNKWNYGHVFRNN